MKSDTVRKGTQQAPHRSLFNALGMTKEEMDKPLVGIVSSYNEIVPGHMNLDKIVNAVKLGVAMAGGTPVVFPAIAVLMRIDKPSVMVVAVDTEHRIYGYTQQEIAENFPKLYVSVVFKPWKEGTEYKDGNWIFRNQFYVPPTYLDCYIAPSVQAEEGGETTEPSKLKAYAYAVDTTAWRIASYIDAAAGVITSKNDPSQTRSNPNFTASKEESGAYGMEVSSPTLMVVVVDQTNEVYAYSKQEVDLDGEPVTFPIVFRTWRPEYLYVEEGWRVVNEKNADPEQEGSDTTK